MSIFISVTVFEMLLKLSAILVILGTASLGEPSARGLCPKFCKCIYSSISQGIARCSTLDPGIQRVFPQDIRHLVVENDPNPKNITESMFLKLGLKKLSTIKIVNSSVSSLHADAFNGLNQLNNVDLSNNRLMLIHPDTFRNNSDLKILVLSGNPLQLTQLLLPIGEYVLRSDSLSQLYLSGCQMNHLSNRAFSELGNLDVLDLSFNSIRHIDPEVFVGLDQLEELDLSYNEFTSVPSDTFSNIEDLTSLDLRGNPLSTFDLPNLSELKELDLSRCNFKSIGKSTFEGVFDVSNLNLSFNMIEKIDPDAFESLANLRYLDLSFNQLTGPLDKFLLEPSSNLESLSLSGNKKLEVLEEFIGDFSFLYYYDISDCGLTTISGKMFKGMHYLATLNMSNNEIGKIEPTSFSGLVHLNVLDLSDNHLKSLHPNIFGSNHEMSKLYLSGNAFYHISPLVPVLRPLTKLYLLDLSYNLLSSLFNHSESLTMQKKDILSEITHLNVAGNYIKHIHIFNFASMSKLQVLDISYNPIECTPNFNRVIKWLSSHRIIPNAERSSHPASMMLDDKVENYRRWVTMLDIVCPIDLNSFSEITTRFSLPKDRSEEVDEPRSAPVKVAFTEEEENDPQVFYRERTAENHEARYKVLDMSDDPNEWSTLLLVTVFCVFIFVAFINIGLIMFFKARRNYSLVGYKSTFSGGPLPQSRFPLRKGQRNAYQKLYEECSVPNTPIVKNGKKLNIISIFGSQTDIPPQPV